MTGEWCAHENGGLIIYQTHLVCSPFASACRSSRSLRFQWRSHQISRNAFAEKRDDMYFLREFGECLSVMCERVLHEFR